MYDRNTWFWTMLISATCMIVCGSVDAGGYQQGVQMPVVQPMGQPGQSQQPPAPQQYPGQQPPGQPMGLDQFPAQMQQMPGNQPPSQPGQYQQPPLPQQYPGQQMQGSQPMMQPGQMTPGQSPCTVKISNDRTSITLIDSVTGQTRDHVTLTPDRAQKAITSPDGAWSLVMFKVRGKQEFGAIPVDLVKCEAQDSFDIPAIAETVQFEGDGAALQLPDGRGEKFMLRKKGR